MHSNTIYLFSQFQFTHFSPGTDPQMMYSQPSARPEVTSVQSHNAPQNNIPSQNVSQNNCSVQQPGQPFYQQVPQQQPLL